MARRSDKLKVSNSVKVPLERAGFSLGQSGGSVLLWGRRSDPESLSSVDDLTIAYDDGAIDGDPSKELWSAQRTEDEGEGFVCIEGLRLDEAIEIAAKLPEPNGRQIDPIMAGAERSPEEALEIAVAMASETRNSL